MWVSSTVLHISPTLSKVLLPTLFRLSPTLSKVLLIFQRVSLIPPEVSAPPNTPAILRTSGCVPDTDEVSPTPPQLSPILLGTSECINNSLESVNDTLVSTVVGDSSDIHRRCWQHLLRQVSAILLEVSVTHPVAPQIPRNYLRQIKTCRGHFRVCR